MKKTVAVKRRTSGRPASPARAEMESLLGELDETDLAQLVTFARTLIYNKKVVEANRAARQLRASVEASGRRESPSGVDVIQLEGTKNFNVLIGNARIFLNLAEIKALVKIAQAAGTAEDGAGRIYRWARKERHDFLIDGGISGPSDPLLKAVWTVLKERFSAG